MKVHQVQSGSKPSETAVATQATPLAASRLSPDTVTYASRAECYFDPDRLLEVVRGGHFEHHLLGGSLFGIQLERVQFGAKEPGAEFCGLDHGSYTMPILIRGSFDGSRVSFGFPPRMQTASTVNGKTLTGDDVQVYAEGAELLYHAGENAEWSVFWIDRADLQAFSERLLGRPLDLPSRGMVNIRCDPQRVACLREALAAAIDTAANSLSHPRVAGHALRSVREHLIDSYILAVTSPGDDEEAVSGEGRSAHVARRILRYLDAAPEASFSLEALCRETSVGPRTLQMHFRDACGVSARSYFLIERLHRARRDLLAGRSERIGVTGVAMRLGFFHLSRFAGQYARYFGETPRQTVRRGSGGRAGVEEGERARPGERRFMVP